MASDPKDLRLTGVRPVDMPGVAADGWPADGLLLDGVARLATHLSFNYDGPLADEPFTVSAFAGDHYLHCRGKTAVQALRKLALAIRERLRARASGLVP